MKLTPWKNRPLRPKRNQKLHSLAACVAARRKKNETKRYNWNCLYALCTDLVASIQKRKVDWSVLANVVRRRNVTWFLSDGKNRCLARSSPGRNFLKHFISYERPLSAEIVYNRRLDVVPKFRIQMFLSPLRIVFLLFGEPECFCQKMKASTPLFWEELFIFKALWFKAFLLSRKHITLKERFELETITRHSLAKVHFLSLRLITNCPSHSTLRFSGVFFFWFLRESLKPRRGLQVMYVLMNDFILKTFDSSN